MPHHKAHSTIRSHFGACILKGINGRRNIIVLLSSNGRKSPVLSPCHGSRSERQNSQPRPQQPGQQDKLPVTTHTILGPANNDRDANIEKARMPIRLSLPQKNRIRRSSIVANRPGIQRLQQ